eukprot:EG_transcript_10023
MKGEGNAKWLVVSTHDSMLAVGRRQHLTQAAFLPLVFGSADAREAGYPPPLPPGPAVVGEWRTIRANRTYGPCGPIHLSVIAPKRGSGSPSLPLVLFSPGFAVGCDQYESYGQFLAMSGYVTAVYDAGETVANNLTDVQHLELIDWLLDCLPKELLQWDIPSGSGVIMVGHSRGGKLAVLTALKDPRVRGVVLLDPVDNTAFAPVSAQYPSAAAALRASSCDTNAPGPPHGTASCATVPMLIIGAGKATDCAPADANHAAFFAASRAPTLHVVLPGVGHLQFLDYQTTLQECGCGRGRVSDAAVRRLSHRVIGAWLAAAVVAPAAGGVDGGVGRLAGGIAAEELPGAPVVVETKGLM